MVFVLRIQNSQHAQYTWSIWRTLPTICAPSVSTIRASLFGGSTHRWSHAWESEQTTSAGGKAARVLGALAVLPECVLRVLSASRGSVVLRTGSRTPEYFGVPYCGYIIVSTLRVLYCSYTLTVVRSQHLGLLSARSILAASNPTLSLQGKRKNVLGTPEYRNHLLYL